MKINDLKPSSNYQSTKGKPEYIKRRKVDPTAVTEELFAIQYNRYKEDQYKKNLKNISQSYSDAIRGKRDREATPQERAAKTIDTIVKNKRKRVQ